MTSQVHVRGTGQAVDNRGLGWDRHDERPVAVEFVTTSLTSQNVGDKMGWEPRTESLALERAWVEAVPYVKFADFDDHGYMIVDVTPERVRGEWWFVDAVREPTGAQHLGAVWEVRSRRTRAGSGSLGADRTIRTLHGVADLF